MTDHVDGPSLLQARDTHNHHHFHSLQNSRGLEDGTDSDEVHIRLPLEQKLQARQVVVVHTVSVLHVIDDTGAVIGHSTLLPEPISQLPNPAAVVTAGLGEVDDQLVSVGDGVLPTPLDPLGSPTSSTSESLLSDTETLTSPPLTSSTELPTLTSGVFNSTRLYSNSTGLFLNTTRTSTARPKSSTSSGQTLLTSFLNSPTDAAGGAGGNVDANGVPAGFPPAPTSSPPAAPTSSGLTPAAQSAVIGGVVGSVAGIALVALFLMFILKWKRGHRSGLLLLGDGEEKGGPRDPFSASKPSGGGGMAEQRSVPFAIPSTLASLTAPRRAIEDGRKEAATGEKGFYRVSGKKLISVLESGGDGYSDPRHSAMSGVSDYRHSEAFVGSSMQRLQLGSPMRPESGVPIFRSGPNRTPVQASGPFSNEFERPVTPPTVDPLGRSITAGTGQGSRGSPSRFSEAM